MRRREAGPPAERLARELEAVEEPGLARSGEREDALEQHRLVRAAGGEQCAVAAHRVLEVTGAELAIGRVHEIVSDGERVGNGNRGGAAGELGGGSVRDLDRGARDPHVAELDTGDRGEPPAARRKQVPQQRADQVDLDVAQPARARPVAAPGLARPGQGHEHLVGDHRARGGQVAMDADRAGERAELGPPAHQLDMK